MWKYVDYFVRSWEHIHQSYRSSISKQLSFAYISNIELYLANF